ncbi:MBL fold metallo-hydrolase [Shewanella sp. Choline-02u-19]|nr:MULTISPECIES: MBL fold metallo-hydrolase [unclassified Shewanella]PKG73748.1 MBL fold metallo-hydrolase [Shewanella sp. GutCb]PKH56328.1 MBL fold metallo-hydrolase [Shewanella sp. Bg11-22]PKI27578.1 MBL fold metallo-hydrolase [Shewanella sp. Choline-02u-19]
MLITSTQRPLYVKQLFDRDSCTYTYLLGDPKTHEGAIIDAVKEHLQRDLQYIEELGIELLYIIETHIHADHITSAGLIRQKTGAQIVYSQAAAVKSIDIDLKEGDELPIGGHHIRAINTPGHTHGCMSFYVDGMVFTGDCLLIRGCGRTDFQEGNSGDLYHSITEKLFSLADETVIYPGHDYNGKTSSTIAEEKQWNPRVGQKKSFDDFLQIMSNLNLDIPKKINEAVPANTNCGINFNPDAYIHNDFSMNALYSVWLKENSNTLIIDNRTKEEYSKGHIPRSHNIPFGTESQHLEELKGFNHIYIYCHSGRRAQTALTNLSIMGLDNITCVSHSGLPEWIAMKYPIER